ncbi:hypothetical protein PIB30_014270 [Stylosanthes scabra]|uniref:Uncharacterized protein n=1 Tax=Stylosanthes scabra TaxID=79078 RepID=A0ABU6Z364_9FABA|nr:hypothetical protein [Stylosanthes scabra]
MLLSCSPMVYTAVLNASLQLNLFDIISNINKEKAAAAAKAPFRGVSASEIASKLDTATKTQHPELSRRLDRMLCLLASYSLLNCSTRVSEDGSVERVFEVSLVGKYFVVNGDGNENDHGSVASFSAFMGHRKLVDAFLNFKDIILDCDKGLFMKTHGMPIYEGIQSDPKWNQCFNKAMANICTIEMKRILEKYNGFGGISLLVDVGGGIGQSLNMIINKYPSIKGINFDLPQVILNAPTYQGIEQIAGDMFESVPKGDAILLKGVLHNWSEEDCLKILSNCYKSLPQNGKVIVVDFIMPEVIQTTEADKMVTSFDNLMFLDSGRERTMKEFQGLCIKSGFSNFQVACQALSALGIMEFCKIH